MRRRVFLGSAILGGALGALGGAVPTRAVPARAQRAEPRGALDVLREAAALGARLKRGEITQLEWQDAIGPTLRGSSPDALRAALGIDALRRRTPIPRRGAAIVRLPIFRELGAEEGAAMRAFFFEAGHGDPPHVHFNQVTAHIVLAGTFRVRHYERVGEQTNAFVLRPSHDRIIEVGDLTSISELRDNGHWHHALTRGVLLDVEQGRLDPSIPIRRRQMVDLSGTPLPDGSIVAPYLDRATALRRYG